MGKFVLGIEKDFAPGSGKIRVQKWLELYRVMKPIAEGHRLEYPSEIESEWENIGLDFNKPIWLYCFK